MLWIETRLVLKGGSQGKSMKWRSSQSGRVPAGVVRGAPLPFEPSSLLTLDKMLEPGALIPPKINFKPSWTLADIDRLSKAKKDCLRLPKRGEAYQDGEGQGAYYVPCPLEVRYRRGLLPKL